MRFYCNKFYAKLVRTHQHNHILLKGTPTASTLPDSVFLSSGSRTNSPTQSHSTERYTNSQYTTRFLTPPTTNKSVGIAGDKDTPAKGIVNKEKIYNLLYNFFSQVVTMSY